MSPAAEAGTRPPDVTHGSSPSSPETRATRGTVTPSAVRSPTPTPAATSSSAACAMGLRGAPPDPPHAGSVTGSKDHDDHAASVVSKRLGTAVLSVAISADGSGEGR